MRHNKQIDFDQIYTFPIYSFVKKTSMSSSFLTSQIIIVEVTHIKYINHVIIKSIQFFVCQGLF